MASPTRTTTEEILGPDASRYFGQGFQRVGHRVTDVAVHPLLTNGTVSATASVDYPTDWSYKSGKVARPHLSTIDALIIGLQLTEAYLTHAHHLDPAARRRIRPLAFDMRAGATAQEQLARIEAAGRRGSVRLGQLDTLNLVSHFDFRIGTLRLSAEVEHDLGTPTTRPATWFDMENLLGDADRRHYGRAFTARRQDVGVITVEPAGSLATGHALVEEDPVVPREGLGAAYEPTLSMVDATVCMAQLGQVLTYSLEGVNRAGTGTFWMRRFGMRFSTPTSPINGPVPMTVRAKRRKRLDRNEMSWRLYDLDGDIGGNPTFASVAFVVLEAADQEGAAR